MKIHTLTLTGADESVDHAGLGRMAALSAAHPWLEWGILFSPRRSQEARYPGWDWCQRLLRAGTGGPMRLAVHLCGGHARKALVGELPPPERLPFALLTGGCERVQINFRSLFPDNDSAGLERFLGACERASAPLGGRPPRLIVQLSHADNFRVAERLARSRFAERTDVLLDGSGGLGLEPAGWPPAPAGFGDRPIGYAGGFDPRRLPDQLAGLAAHVGGATVNVDMESRLRAPFSDIPWGPLRGWPDRFDLDLCEAAVRAAQPYALN